MEDSLIVNLLTIKVNLVYHKTVYRLKPCILAEFGEQKTPNTKAQEVNFSHCFVVSISQEIKFCFLKLAVFLSCLYLQNLGCLKLLSPQEQMHAKISPWSKTVTDL